MKITKFGHSCFLAEEKGVRILFDPGAYSDGQNDVKDISVVLITHEHQDHFHADSLKTVLKNNLQTKLITNRAVGAILRKEGIEFGVLEDGQVIFEKGISIEAFGKDHALMHSSIPPIRNTGYFIADRLFYPGDAFTNPGRAIEILALPVAGPWMKLPEAIDYALALKPKVCFPVHEGGMKIPGSVHRIPPQVLGPRDINFVALDIGKEYEF